MLEVVLSFDMSLYLKEREVNVSRNLYVKAGLIDKNDW